VNKHLRVMAVAAIALCAAVFVVAVLASGGLQARASEGVSAQAVPSLSALNLTLTRRWSGLSNPLYLTAPPGDTGRNFVVEKGGRIKIVKPGGVVVARPYLDLSAHVTKGNEQGLLGLAFAPDFLTNGRFYVNYTDVHGDTLVKRYIANDPASDAPSFTSVVVTKIGQPYANHNGGCLQFGPDRYLYIGTGDGGSAGDPQERAQNPKSRLGKMLRIDVGELPGATVPATWRVPPSNPFVGNSRYNPSIWALGLRNPWRFSFDRANGSLWIGDVGQSSREEIDHMGAGIGGYNFGWDRYEGFATYPPGSPAPSNPSKYRKPLIDHRHPSAESITGGYVYRGTAYPDLRGTYIYGDYLTGKIWGLRRRTTTQNHLLRNTSLLISSFGENAAGELYLCDFHNDAIYQVGEN